MKRKPKTPVLPPISEARQAIFTTRNNPEGCQRLHAQLCNATDEDYATWIRESHITPTTDRETTGNALLIAHFVQAERTMAAIEKMLGMKDRFERYCKSIATGHTREEALPILG